MSTETTASGVHAHPGRGIRTPRREWRRHLPAARAGSGAAWVALGGSATDAGRPLQDLPALPGGTLFRLDFETEAYSTRAKPMRSRTPPANQDSDTFFPEVACVRRQAGRHYHVPLLLNPFDLRLPRELNYHAHDSRGSEPVQRRRTALSRSRRTAMTPPHRDLNVSRSPQR